MCIPTYSAVKIACRVLRGGCGGNVASLPDFVQNLAVSRRASRFVGAHSPEHVEWCAQIRLIPYKKTSQPGITYLDKAGVTLQPSDAV
jgi:hypothetical protein